MWSQQSVPIDWYRDYRIDEYTQNNPFTTSADNPYMQAYEQLNTMLRNRVYGNVSLNIRLTEHLSLMLRSGLDMNNEHRSSPSVRARQPTENIKSSGFTAPSSTTIFSSDTTTAGAISGSMPRSAATSCATTRITARCGPRR